MCLENASDIKQAKRNIVCYKRLEQYKRVKYNMKEGDCATVTCKDDKIIVAGCTIVTFGNELFLRTRTKLPLILRHYEHTEDGRLEMVYEITPSIDSLIINGEEVRSTESVYETPYMSALVTIGETYTSNLVKEGDHVEEALHSFVTKDGAIDDAYADNVIVKCIIPKGSQYCVGTFGKDKSYASTALKYECIIRALKS